MLLIFQYLYSSFLHLLMPNHLLQLTLYCHQLFLSLHLFQLICKMDILLYPLFQKKAQTDSHISFTLASSIYPTPSFVGVKGHPNCMGQKRLATELICHVENRMKGAW